MKGTYFPNLKQVKDRITVLENTLIKVAYYAEITNVSGQISIPENTTVLFDQWANGVDAILSKIVSGKPDFQDTGVDVLTFDLVGNYSINGDLPSSPTALIYYIAVPLKYLENLDVDYIIEYVELKAELELIQQFINFDTTLNNPTYNEGRIFYDKGKKAVSYYNEIQDITVNLGQEILIRVLNNSGSSILNGAVVYPTGFDNTEGCITIGLAISSIKDRCRSVAVVTHDIPNNTVGYVTKLGEVGGMDTSLLSGTLYLSSTIAGGLTNIRPSNGAFPVIVGQVKKQAVQGSIVIDTHVSDLTVETVDTNGFSGTQRTNTILSFVDSTRTFTISANSYPFHYYIDGAKYEITVQKSIVITDIEGLYVFYFDGEDLVSLRNPDNIQIDTVIRTKAIVAYIYWDATNKVSNYFADERHGILMDCLTHAYLHFLKGAQHISGLSLTDIITEGNGTSDSHAQFGVESGIIIDEDILTNCPTILSTTGLPIYYLSGAGNLRRIINTGFSVLTDVVAGIGSSGRLVYNQNVAGNWQLTAVTSANFVVYHVLCVNGLDGRDKQICLIGQNQYGTINAARAAISSEVANLTISLKIQELIFIGSLIFETKDSFTNAVKAVVRLVEPGVSYVDYLRKTGVEGTTGTFDTSDGKVVYVQNGIIKRIV